MGGPVDEQTTSPSTTSLCMRKKSTTRGGTTVLHIDRWLTPETRSPKSGKFHNSLASARGIQTRDIRGRGLIIPALPLCPRNTRLSWGGSNQAPGKGVTTLCSGMEDGEHDSLLDANTPATFHRTKARSDPRGPTEQGTTNLAAA